MAAYTNALSSVRSSFESSEGVAERVKAAIQSTEELEKLNSQMRGMVAKQIEESKKEVSQAGVNQENVVLDLNRAAQRNLTMVIVIGVLIGAVALLMSLGISRSITRPITRVIEGLTQGADRVASASAQVLAESRSLAEGASAQAAGIEKTSSSIETTGEEGHKYIGLKDEQYWRPWDHQSVQTVYAIKCKPAAEVKKEGGEGLQHFGGGGGHGHGGEEALRVRHRI